MPKTVILSAARTPIGKMGGGLAAIDATELGGTAIKAALERAEVAPDQVQQVVMGQVLQAGQGQIPSRQAQIKADMSTPVGQASGPPTITSLTPAPGATGVAANTAVTITFNESVQLTSINFSLALSVRVAVHCPFARGVPPGLRSALSVAEVQVFDVNG